MTQYLACSLSAQDRRKYTYRNDGEPLAVGDKVEVDTNRGTAKVTVVEIVGAPSFATKAILGKVEAE